VSQIYIIIGSSSNNKAEQNQYTKQSLANPKFQAVGKLEK
jgi:hypothetical protein